MFLLEYFKKRLKLFKEKIDVKTCLKKNRYQPISAGIFSGTIKSHNSQANSDRASWHDLFTFFSFMIRCVVGKWQLTTYSTETWNLFLVEQEKIIFILAENLLLLWSTMICPWRKPGLENEIFLENDIFKVHLLIMKKKTH